MRQKIRAIFLLLSLMVGIAATALPVASVQGDNTTCGTLATDKGQQKQSVQVPKTGNYTMWLRMHIPNADADSVYAQVDSTCVVVAGASRTGDGFAWINYREGDTAKKLEFDLTSGNHTITIAGREVGAGLDKIMLVSDSCEPVDTGENCLASTVAATTTKGDTNGAKTAQPKAVRSSGHWVIVSLGITVIIIMLGLLLWRYVSCVKHHGLVTSTLQQPTYQGMTVGIMPASPSLVQKGRLFIGHHKLFVAICAAVIVAACATSVVFAADSKPVFEAETATLSGGVKVVDDAAASNGKYVVFEANGTPGTVGTPSGGQGNKNSTNNTSQSGGATSTGGGGSSGSTGSTGNPYPDRYSVGAPGVGHYAQSDATLPVPPGYTEYFPSDGSSKAYNMYSCSGATNFDKAYFHAYIYVGTGCHGTINITNSIIAPPPGSNQRAMLVNADTSASLTINISDSTFRPEPVPLGGTNNALTDHVLNDCDTCSIHMNRVDVANSGGMCLCGQNTVIEHSWLHDSYIAHLSDPSLAHTGGVFPYGGAGPLEIKYNRLEPGVNAATGAEVPNYWKAITAVLFTQSELGSTLRDYAVHHNFISLGSFDMGLEDGEDLSIHDNVFGPNHFGYITTCSSGCSVNIATWTNNVLGNIDGTPTTTILPKPF